MGKKNYLAVHIGPLKLGFSGSGMPHSFTSRLYPFASKEKADVMVRTRFSRKKAETDGMVSLTSSFGRLTAQREDLTVTVDTGNRGGNAVMARNYLTFNSCCRILASELLRDKDALLFHAAGLVVNGGGYLFAGISGAGKSTIVKNSKQLVSLGDEMAGVGKAKKKYFTFSTPFGGELSTPRVCTQRPLKGIFLIKKTRSIDVTRLSVTEALPSLLRCVVNFSRDAAAVAWLTDFATEMARHVPIYQLQTTIDTDFNDVYKNYL